MITDHVQHTLTSISSAIGKGVLAGLVGTAAITVSQLIEMQFTKRKPSSAPAKVAGQVMGVVPSNKDQAAELSGEPVATGKSNKQVKEEHQERFSQMIHWEYGTSWGLARGAMEIAGLTGWAATAAHFGAVWGTAQVILPAANASEPITEWSPKQIATDALHHGIYAIAAGVAYDFLTKAEKEA
ncbi:hypothetical protein [Rufibacter roseus]|uniref:DUF1440 domain-containing protein n=1 Tax=Rufibacter roseus TaxID=1567108 RepID=A0ABW2DQG5_9BACT|nr:hypothetical protein [Rufibacter roseus]